MEPVNTRGSEYFDLTASGSRETGGPLLYAPVNWYLGMIREKTGASTCHQETMLETLAIIIQKKQSVGEQHTIVYEAIIQAYIIIFFFVF